MGFHFFSKSLPMGPESTVRGDLASLRHSIDTASPLVVHGIRSGAVSTYDGRRFFALQRDITSMLREVINHEDESKWQKKNVELVKKAIKIGFQELDTMYMTLSLVVATHGMNEGEIHGERNRQRRKYLESSYQSVTSASGSSSRESY